LLSGAQPAIAAGQEWHAPEAAQFYNIFLTKASRNFHRLPEDRMSFFEKRIRPSDEKKVRPFSPQNPAASSTSNS